MDSPPIDVPRTYGALLLGGFMAFGLSGVVCLQSIVYFKLFPEDFLPTKALVVAVWILDILHSSFICSSLFDYFITFHGDDTKIDYIPWSIAFTVLINAMQTYLVHCFFAQKILKCSKKDWYITGPIVLLALLRMWAASVSTIEMIRLHQYSAFVEVYPGWVFTTGLSLSSVVDILIMGWLCYFLHEIRARVARDSTMMMKVVDSLTLYTLENGALTCLTTIASLICWLTMRKNLVFLGLHFVIGKLYANSLLASLNTRNELRMIHSPRTRWRETRTRQKDSIPLRTRKSQETEINVERRSGEESRHVSGLTSAYLRHGPPREPTTLIQWRAA